METSTTNPTTIPTFDACVSAITSPDGEIPLTVREEEGSDLHVVTVSLALVQLQLPPTCYLALNLVAEVRERLIVRGIIC